MTAGAGSNSLLNVFPASSSSPRTRLFDATGFMLADLEAGPPAMPYRQPPAPVHLGMPPGVAAPMPGYLPMGQPAHLHGLPPMPFVPCVPMPMGAPGMPGPGVGLPAHVQHNLQYPQQVQPLGLQAQQLQPPPAHPTWQERFGQPAQLQQQQQGLGPGQQQQQPGLAAAASGDQDAGLQQLQHPPAEQQQDPGRQGGLRLRIVMPRGMQQRLSSPGEQAQQQQLPQNLQRGPAGAGAAASGQAGLQVPGPPPPSPQYDQQQQQEQPGQEADAAAAGPPQAPLTRAQRKNTQHQQQREAVTAAAAAAAALRGLGPGTGHGQPAAAAAAVDARMPPGLRTVRFTREVTQVDFFLGTRQQQHQQRSSATPWTGNQQQQQQRAGYGAAPLRGAIAAGLGPLQPEQYFKQYAVDTNPFWGSALPHDFAGVLATTTLQPPAGRTPGSTAMATCELAVTLSAQQVQQLQAGTAAVQLWCFKLGDTVPYRVHWPYTNQQLLVNDARAAPVMAKRLKVGELQPHQGDLQVDVTRQALASTGLPANRLSGQARLSVLMSAQVVAPSASGPYGGGYVLGCRLVRARSIQEVKDMLAEPPELAEAVEELQQKLAGDEDVVAAATTVATRCAASMVPMQTPANFGTGEGLVCFDLDKYLEMTQKSGKWQCPGTRKFHTWRTLQTSPFVAAVLQCLEEAGLKDSSTHVEVAPDAKWRPQGAARSCWFDVLHPPTSQQIRASLQPGAAAAGAAGKNGELLEDSDGDGEGSKRAAKRQRREPQKQLIVIDSDSDDERPAPAAAAGDRGQVPRPGSGVAAAAQGGRAGAAAAAGPAGGRNAQQQQQPAHRHAQQHQASRAEWVTQAEMLRRAQERQHLRLVHQGSGTGGVGPYTAMLLEGSDAEQTQQQGRGAAAAAAAAAGQESTGSGHVSDSWRVSDSEDKPYNPFEDIDDDMAQAWADSAGAGAEGRSAQQQNRGRGSNSAQAAQALRQDRTVDAMLAAIAADFDGGRGPADEGATGDLRNLRDMWRAGRWPAQQQRQQQQVQRQQQRRQPAPAPRAPAQQAIEVIEILSDSD